MARGRAHGYVISYYMLAWLRLVSSPKSLEKSPRIPEKCLSSLLFHAFFYTVDGQNLSLIDMNHIPRVPVLGPIPTSACLLLIVVA